MTRILPTATALALLVVTATTAAAGPVEEIETQIVKAHSKLTSYRAKVHTIYRYDPGHGTIVELESKGIHEWKRKGDQILFRDESAMEERQVVAGREQTVQSLQTYVCDGEFKYIYTDKLGNKHVNKHEADPQSDGDVSFEGWREYFNLKALPEETVNGQPCYVIEATATEKSPWPGERYVHWYSKDLGLEVRSILYNKNDEVMRRTNTTDIEVNVPISDDRFEFQIPEGTKVDDMTQRQGSSGG